jgi:flagellar hook-basal body complex protein FliE
MRVLIGIIFMLLSISVQSQEPIQSGEMQNVQTKHDLKSTTKGQRDTAQSNLVVNVKTDTASLEKTIRDVIKQVNEKQNPTEEKLAQYTKDLTDLTRWLVIATFAAVLVALIFPLYQEHKQNRNILLLIKKELDENYSKLASTEKWSDQTISGQTFSAIDQKIAFVKHIKFKIWSEFKYKLAVYNSDEFEKYKQHNDILEQMTDSINEMIVNPNPATIFACKDGLEAGIKLFIANYKKAHVRLSDSLIQIV